MDDLTRNKAAYKDGCNKWVPNIEKNCTEPAAFCP